MDIYDNLPKDLQYMINDYLLPEMDQVMNQLKNGHDYKFCRDNFDKCCGLHGVFDNYSEAHLVCDIKYLNN